MSLLKYTKASMKSLTMQEKFDYAIIIREKDKQKRKRVGLDFQMQEGDIIEIHIK